MTRWVRGIYEGLKPLESLSVEGLVRVWAHEALRLFHDQWVGMAIVMWLSCDCSLVLDEERIWTEENIDTVALKHFSNIDKQVALKRPILYSNWFTKVSTLYTLYMYVYLYLRRILKHIFIDTFCKLWLVINFSKNDFYLEHLDI